MAGTEPSITNITCSTAAAFYRGDRRWWRPLPWLSETNNVGYASPVSPGDEQEAGAGGGAAVKDEKRCLRRGGLGVL